MCLLSPPDVWLRTWRVQLGMLHAEGEATIDVFEEEQRKPGLLRSTRSRLERQALLTRQVLREVDAFMAPIGQRLTPDAPLPNYRPMEMVHLLHRDWGWPHSDENDVALKLVEKVLPSGPLGKVLVLGAGAGRLAYDLHRTHAAQVTVAIDIDPLALLVADQVLKGLPVALTEPRANATELEQLSTVRALKAPMGPVVGLHLLLADGLRPPVQALAFDMVVTPWFIDVGSPDIRELLGELHRALVPGGRWIHFGPLLYPPSRPMACRYSREELFELAAYAGFELEQSASQLLTYALSPLTERGRLEQCLAFSAIKTDRRFEGELPRWLVLPHLSVPNFPRLQVAQPSVAIRAVLELIDGSRSINEIAATLIARSGTRATAVKDSVRHCLLMVHPECIARND